MNQFLLIWPVFFPILAGISLLFLRHWPARRRNILTFTCAIINMAVVLTGACVAEGASVVLFDFIYGLKLSLGYDDLGRLFAVLVSVLWPFSLLYSYEYMEEEERPRKFYAFYLMSLGATVGIAYSNNMFAMYIFYEVLTLTTFPLVMHTMTREAMKAGLKYLCYMFGGAAFAFFGMMVITKYSASLEFIPGGVLEPSAETARTLMLITFSLTFCGFSVKAAMMPFGRWLIDAAVAPMPVTGLLHAVAVVKAGAFACIRLVYYIYGTDFVRGTWAQYLCIVLASCTIIYGSAMAVREHHVKRRLAYSTISNLSYILFGALLMTPMGLTASLSHLIVHAVTKLGMFFAAGAVMHVTGRSYVEELDGIGRYMKKIMVMFTICSLSLIGIPQLAGFVSKLQLILAAIDEGCWTGYLGGGAIILSALLTAIYLLTIVIRAYFPHEGRHAEGMEEAHDPAWRMLVPIGLMTVAVIVIGILWEPMLSYLDRISSML